MSYRFFCLCEPADITHGFLRLSEMEEGNKCVLLSTITFGPPKVIKSSPSVIASGARFARAVTQHQLLPLGADIVMSPAL